MLRTQVIQNLHFSLSALLTVHQMVSKRFKYEIPSADKFISDLDRLNKVPKLYSLVIT